MFNLSGSNWCPVAFSLCPSLSLSLSQNYCVVHNIFRFLIFSWSIVLSQYIAETTGIGFCSQKSIAPKSKYPIFQLTNKYPICDIANVGYNHVLYMVERMYVCPVHDVDIMCACQSFANTNCHDQMKWKQKYKHDTRVLGRLDSGSYGDGESNRERERGGDRERKQAVYSGTLLFTVMCMKYVSKKNNNKNNRMPTKEKQAPHKNEEEKSEYESKKKVDFSMERKLFPDTMCVFDSISAVCGFISRGLVMLWPIAPTLCRRYAIFLAC